MDEIISITKELREISISDKDRKFLLRIINNYYHQPRFKNKNIIKLKNLLRITDRKYLEQIISFDQIENLIKEQIVEKVEQTDSSPHTRTTYNNSINHSYKFTYNGLMHVLSHKYMYPPNFLLTYENNIILQRILFQFFQPITIKSSTAKFFNIITDYLSNISTYLILFSRDIHETVIESKKQELDQNIKIFSFELAFKIIILYNESNLISPSIQLRDEKAILAIHEIETNMKKILSMDNKFQNLLHKAFNEFNSGYRDIIDI